MSADKQLPTIQGVTFAPFQLTQTAPLTPLEQKLYSALTTQADFIEEIVNRNRELFKKLEMLKREMTQLQEQTQEGEKEDERTEQPGKDTVVGLIGNETGRYEWALEVDGRLPEPLCKGKYFQFKVKLVPLHETPFPLEERVQLTVAIYSAEKTPKPIQSTMTGHPLLKGYPESMLSYNPADKCHVAYFKIQICEVSSHFRNGWVFLVVQPKYTGASSSESMITMIRPLAQDNVIVRAKEITAKRSKQKFNPKEAEEMDLFNPL